MLSQVGTFGFRCVADAVQPAGMLRATTPAPPPQNAATRASEGLREAGTAAVGEGLPGSVGDSCLRSKL